MKKKYFNKSTIFITLLFIIVFYGFTTFQLYSNDNPQTVTLKIIATTDVHGAYFPYDFIKAEKAQTSLAQVYTYVKAQRKNKMQEVILLDNGDILQGQPVVYYYNFEVPQKPHICAELLNFMDYQAGSVGNHDIETGHPVYDRIAKEFNFPWLSANSVDINTNKPYFKPYTIIVRKGIKVAVIGLTTPHIPKWLPENIWKGIRFDDMIESAKQWMQIIKEKEHPHVIIGLFHSGVDSTYGEQSTTIWKNENASRLIPQHVPGFDLIIAGHDHKKYKLSIKDPKEHNVLLLDPMSSAKAVASTTIKLTYDKQSQSWNKNITGNLVDISKFEAAPEIMEKFAPAIEEVKKYVSRKIGSFQTTISTKEAMFGDSAFVDLIHSFTLEKTGADISFAAPLSFNMTIPEGDIFVRDMFKLYRYENLLYTMKLTGKEIKNYLEYSYARWFNTMKNQDDHLINFKRDKSGNLKHTERYDSYELAHQYYNFDSAGGIVYEVDVSKPEGQRISITSMADGTPFNIDGEYKVAINSYRGNGGGGHLTVGAGIPQQELAKRILNSTTKDLRYFLMKWIEKKKTIIPKAAGNWKVIPTQWWEKAKEKDFNLLFKAKK